MTTKKSQSLISRLPAAAGADTDQSDYMFRFDRLPTGDHLDVEEGDGTCPDEEFSKKNSNKIRKKPSKLVPPEGVQPPTAADLYRHQRHQHSSGVDCCSPVEYINTNSEDHIQKDSQVAVKESGPAEKADQETGRMLVLEQTEAEAAKKAKEAKQAAKKRRLVVEMPDHPPAENEEQKD